MWLEALSILIVDMIPTIEYKLQKPLESQYRGFLILLFWGKLTLESF